MKTMWSIYFFVFTALHAKPIIDFRADNIWRYSPSIVHERPEFVFISQGKNSDLVVLSDQCIQEADQMRICGYQKVVACLMESRVVSPHAVDYVFNNIYKFDLVLTFDDQLLKQYPNLCRFIPAFVPNFIEHSQIYKKTKLCSMVSGATQGTYGRQLRKQVLDRFKSYLDDYKDDSTPRTLWKDQWMDDFCFSIAIENCQAHGYFTEKILDCFNSGTIPIYWGCPNIDEFFNPEGIIIFNSLDELEEILNTLSFEVYQSRLLAVYQNFELAKKYPAINCRDNPSLPCITDIVWKQIKESCILENSLNKE